VVVGVNAFTDDVGVDVPVMAQDPAVEQDQVERVVAHRSSREVSLVDSALERVRTGAADTQVNLLPLMKDALRSGATLGEVSAALADVFGRFGPTS